MRKTILIYQAILFSLFFFASGISQAVTLPDPDVPLTEGYRIVSEIDGDFDIGRSDVVNAGYIIADENVMMAFIDEAIAWIKGIPVTDASALNACRSGESTCFEMAGIDGNSLTFYPFMLGRGLIPSPDSPVQEGGDAVPFVLSDGGNYTFDGGFGTPVASISSGGIGTDGGWLAKPVPVPPAFGLLLMGLVGLLVPRKSTKV